MVYSNSTSENSISSESNLIFIDSNIDNYQTIISGVNNAEIILLDSTRDGIEQITETLSNYDDVSSIEILSHGQEGGMQLGSTTLNHSNLGRYASELTSWSESITANGDILLYGCNIAAGATGVDFINQLSQLTDADIAASNNLTGNSQLGGDWDLEVTTGEIETITAISDAATNAFNSVLATYNGKEYQLTSQALSWEQAQTEAVSLGGNLVAINNAAEETWLKQTFGSNERLWIGLSDRDQEGNFQWVNGENTTYHNWASGEPNDYKFGGAFTAGEDYAQMNWGGSRQWNDMPDSYAGTFRGIIEIPQTPETYIYNGKEYQLTSQALSWEQAQTEAVSLGGNLVTINNAAEETWLKQTFGSNERLWIGLSDRDQEGNFQWVNGENTTYRNWASGEPNDYKFGGAFTAGEDYAQMNWGGSRQWNDMPNSYAGTFRGIIELGDNAPNNPGVISLATSTYQVNETDGTVDVTILRTQGSDGSVSIDYDTVDASGTAGNDYIATSGTLTFADGETSKTVAISILNDNLTEGNEEFGFTIDNIVGDATLLAPRTALITIVDDETGLEPIIDYNDFADTSQLNLNGNATQASNVLRLTSSGQSQAGSTFFERPLAINGDTSFATQFQFQISGGSGGADGFTFMLQNSNQALNSLGYAGGDLGYGSVQNNTTSGISQSLAIEFDTYQNGGWDDNNNHISVLRDGDVINALTTIAAPFDLNSGSILNTWIDYDGATDLLEIFLADSLLKPNSASLSFNIELDSVVGEQAFLGFSAGTGGLVNNHDILNWEFTTNSSLLPAPPSSASLNSETVISGLNQPTAIEWTPNGDRFFVAEKGGVIKVFENGQLNNTPFIDLSAQVNGTRDRGLLDIAVHPDFFNGSPYVYALYTYDPPEVFQNTGLAGPDGNGNRAARLTRITADASNDYKTALPGSEVVILGTNSTWDNFNAFANSTNDFGEPAAGILPDGTNLRDFLAADSESHTIGSVEFGPDGALYISNGDGTSYNQVDPRTVRVQDIDNLSGKIIRIDPITGEGLADNPFYNGNPDANRSKVYQYGLQGQRILI